VQIWSAFYAVIGGAAAWLMGLLFVAVSINATAILNEAHGTSRRLGEQAFHNYVVVLLVSLLALVPSLTTSEFSLVTLVLTGISAIWMPVRIYFAFTRPHDGGSRPLVLIRHLFSLIVFAMLIFASGRMALKMGDSRNLLAASTVVLLFAATRASWELLQRQRLGKRTNASMFPHPG
jgi:hypothetical protein